MLRLTTTEAYSLILDSIQPRPKTPVVEEIGVFVNKAGRWCGYLHGRIQDVAGFDLPHFITGELPDREGEIPCVVALPQGDFPCTLVQWQPKDDFWKYRALICMDSDEESLKYAREQARNKANSI
jgi:hypothetical protein